jgi:hypothetical protein
LKVAVTEMYPHIPWQLVAEPLGISEHTLGTTDVDHCVELFATI